MTNSDPAALAQLQSRLMTMADGLNQNYGYTDGYIADLLREAATAIEQHAATARALVDACSARDNEALLKRLAMAEMTGYRDGAEGMPHYPDRFDAEWPAYTKAFSAGRALRVQFCDGVDALERRQNENIMELKDLKIDAMACLSKAFKAAPADEVPPPHVLQAAVSVLMAQDRKD